MFRTIAMRRRIVVAFSSLAALSAGLLSSNAEAQGSGDSVKGGKRQYVLALPSGAPSISVANFLTGPSGPNYYAQEGIDLRPEYVNGSSISVQLVASGKADFTFSGTIAALTATKSDNNLVIVGLTPGNPYVFAVSNGSDIKSLTELKGKNIGIQSVASAQYPLAAAVLKEAGMDPEKDVKWISIGTGAQAAAAIRSREVDAFVSYLGQYEQIEAQVKGGMRLLKSGLEKYQGLTCVLTSREIWKKDREGVEKMLRALSKSFAFSSANPGAAVLIHYDVFPEQKPRGLSSEQAAKNGASLVAAKFEDYAKMNDGKYMYFPPSEFAHTLKFFKNNKFIDPSIEVGNILDLSAVDKANNFDRQAVINEAKNWKARK